MRNGQETGAQMIRLQYKLSMSAESEQADIMIYGEICGDAMKWSESDVSATDFDKVIKDAKKNGAKRLNIRINSPGGDVNQAIAMRTMLMNIGMEQINISIEGMCASAATLIACLPDARVTMHEGSEYMIHNPRMIAWGEAREFESCAKRLRNTEADVARIYARKCGKDEDEIRRMMDNETWMSATEALDAGFVDIVPEESAIVASVTRPVMDYMRRMYARIPEGIEERTEDAPNVRPEQKEAAAECSTEYTQTTSEEESEMEVNELTLEQLRQGNAPLYEEIMRAGAEAERERIQEIDDMTISGYEEMAAQAKADGTSAMDYHKMVVKAQKQKGKEFLANRQNETADAAKVTGESAEEKDGQNEEQEMERFAKEMQAYAAGMTPNGYHDGMY